MVLAMMPQSVCDIIHSKISRALIGDSFLFPAEICLPLRSRERCSLTVIQMLVWLSDSEKLQEVSIQCRNTYRYPIIGFCTGNIWFHVSFLLYFVGGKIWKSLQQIFLPFGEPWLSLCVPVLSC